MKGSVTGADLPEKVSLNELQAAIDLASGGTLGLSAAWTQSFDLEAIHFEASDGVIVEVSEAVIRAAISNHIPTIGNDEVTIKNALALAPTIAERIALLEIDVEALKVK